MMMFDWSSDNVWTVTFPTSDLTYCNVINTEIVDVTEDGDTSTAVYFHENGACY